MPELSLAPFYQIDPPPNTLLARLAAVEASVTEESSELSQLAADAHMIQKKFDTVSALLTTTFEQVNEICCQADILASTAQGYLVGQIEPLTLFHQIAATRAVLQEAGWLLDSALPVEEESTR